MVQILQLGDPPIDVVVKSSARARRLSLRVSGVDGRVSLTMPRRAAMSEARAFLNEKEGWIRDHLADQPGVIVVEPGVQISIEGLPRLIVEADRRTVRLRDDQIEVPSGAAKTGARVAGFLKTLARDRLAEASFRYSAKVGCPIGRITLRDTRSRWGSCSSEGNLMYSWRLILAPPEVLDYVAAHEVAHLVEMNHSRHYWAVVERILPGYHAPRRWLRKNGAALHRYKF